MSSDVESSFHVGSDSEDYIPTTSKAEKAPAAAKKAPAAKKTPAATKKATTSKAPLKKRKSNEGEAVNADDSGAADDGDFSMSLIDAVEGKGAGKKSAAAGPSNGKSASETYQKVRSEHCCAVVNGIH